MNDTCDLSERIGSLLFDDKFSDMNLIVEGQRFAAHKAILSASCDYFRDVLSEYLGEPLECEIVLEDVAFRNFRQMMNFIYTGRLGTDEADEDTLLTTLELAHRFGSKELQTAIPKHLQAVFSKHNVCRFYAKARSLENEDLELLCRRFMAENPDAVSEEEDFYLLSATALRDVLSLDTFGLEEIDIFRIVQRWCATRPADDDGVPIVLGALRLHLIPIKHLKTTVKSSALISPDRLSELIETRMQVVKNMNYAASLDRTESLTFLDNLKGMLTATKICETVLKRLLPVRPAFRTAAKTSWIFAFDASFYINHVSFQLSQECSYYIEASLNLEEWFQVIDHSIYVCSSLQRLFFEPRAVRFIRVKLTGSPATDRIKLSNFEALYIERRFKLFQGLYAPKENVATPELGAAVIEGKNKKNGLLRGISTIDSPEYGWTWHTVDHDSIIIQLPQPVVVGSMRMFLYGYKSQAYSYTVEISLNRRDWTVVAKKYPAECRKWQIITFKPLPVTFIRIVGTGTRRRNTDVFLCSRFECPAQVLSEDECLPTIRSRLADKRVLQKTLYDKNL